MKKLALLFCLSLAQPAQANDTTAELRPGGLVFVRSDVVSMMEEDLFISPDEVRVDYVFLNQSREDVEAIVAFPMPDLQADPYADLAVPISGSDNFMGFTVEVDGVAVAPQLEQRAFAAELDVSAALTAAGIGLNHARPEVHEALQKLPDQIKADWTDRGILMREMHDDGSGMRSYVEALWRLKSTYWWRMRFPAGRPVSVRHRYRPSVGGTVAVTFLTDGRQNEPYYSDYVDKYCIDDAFVGAVRRAADRNPDGYAPFVENWIAYVLKTGANWAGTIGSFKLTVDKGKAENLVSFCGEDVRKVGPTTFEMTAKDFHPERDIDILLLQRMDSQ